MSVPNLDITIDNRTVTPIEKKRIRLRDKSRISYSRLNSPARIRRRAKQESKARASVVILSPRTSANDSYRVQPFVPSDDIKYIQQIKSKNQYGEQKEVSSMLNMRSSLRFDKSNASVKTANMQVYKTSGGKTDGSVSSIDNTFNSRTSLSEKFSNSSFGSFGTPPQAQSRSDIRESRLAVKQIRKLKTLATLLPDELIFDPTGRKPRHYNTALMFPDVSGFTQLCEKYDKTGQGGPSRLTEVLNGYIGSMIQIVLSRDGDVCKFGGDAFLCVWKVPPNADIREIVHLAIESAVDIQKRCGEHKTDVGVKLGVKIAVAAGKALFSIIGTETRKHYVIVGPPILDVKEAEKFCKPGDVIVAPSAWKYVENYTLYSYTYHQETSYVKVHDFGPLWKSAKPFFKKTPENPNSLSTRPFLKRFVNLRVEDIRPFILPPVMKSIDLNQSLDYLTEMRQVAIVFINIAADFKQMKLEDWTILSHQAFQIVSLVADKADGAVNKLTLFDKDMAILVVFGLKGFKHELASQIALKCAYNCLVQLKKLNVDSVSAGVTTGMVYCGVIGHVLRKEYTVMGHPVNMAARLMCAYLNMVSLDRETFLHSKLESGHFELLEPKHLKGIKTPGPFYKFHLHPMRTKVKLDYQAYPILGRKKEIQEFERWLSLSKTGQSTTNFMVIFGQARIGKSRLVAKLINVTQKAQSSEDNLSDTEVPKRSKRRPDHPDRVDIWVIPLSEDDSKSSYSAAKLIFQPVLGLRDTSTIEEREDKILSKLGEMRDLYMLASFNPIFNVNFDLMPQYVALTQQDQMTATESMIKKLYKKCFPKGARWLLVIEDAEYMDEESWHVLKWCSNQSPTVLYLMTIGQHRTLSASAMSILDSLKPNKITLKDLEKWYFAGLACQILGVRAIPAELVNVMQMHKNSGNPGWLESFLLSLLQSGSIYIDQAPSHQIKNMRLITVPDEMLSSSKDMDAKDTSYWVDCVENFEHLSDSENNMSVCLLGPTFYTGEDSEAELTMDLMIIKTIDTLRPLDQTVLKAGSVLGNNFKRSMLKYVINKEFPLEERVLAKAIRNLFDIKILTCAKGDLTQTNLLAPRRMILVQSMKKEVTCECNGVIIPEECKDLPLYANCGYMQFRSPNCRETVYNLLLDEQKKKYHSSSIEFLRKNTFKCKYCNGVPFTSVFGEGTEDQVTLVCTKTPMHGVRSTSLNPSARASQGPPRFSKGQPLFRNFGRYTKTTSLDSATELTPTSDIEIGDCHCSDILASVYSVLLEHAAGSGKKDVMLEIMLEYASVSLTSYNFPLTTQILEEALSLVNQMKEDKDYAEFCSPYIYGKIYTLMGATKLSIGRPDDSLELLEKSLTYLKCRLAKNPMRVKSKIRKEKLKQKLFIDAFPNKMLGKAKGRKGVFFDLLSECLGLISIVYMYKQNYLMAKYVTLMGLNKALESNKNFYGLCTNFSNMMDIAYHNNDMKTCAKMEICAINVCRRCTKTIIETYELEAVCRLYRVIFQTRYVRAEIEEAVFIGFQSVRIAAVIRSTTLRLDLMPDLIYALIQMNRLSEAVSLLQELEFSSLLDSDKSSRIWYYAICLDFQLDTGYTILPYDTCQQFVKVEEENIVVVRDPNSKHRLYGSLWLWCVRNDEWELAKTYSKILKSFNIMEEKGTPSVILTRLKRLEGLLITLVHRMDTRNIYSITATFSEIHVLIKKLEKDIKSVRLLKPRFFLLKAYYRQIRYRDDSYQRILNQAQSLADKIKDKNASEWIHHLKTVWDYTISPIQRDYWVEHCRYNLIDWHEFEKTSIKQTTMYSLPLPKF